MAIKLTLPDGGSLELEDGSTGLDAARKIGPRLADAAVAVKVDEVDYDLSRSLPGGGRVAGVNGRPMSKS